MDNSKNIILGLTHLYPENYFFKNLLAAIDQYPHLVNENFLTHGQIQSKRWVVTELEKLKMSLGVIYLTPGWYGLLAQFISESSIFYNKIRSFDIDQESVLISDLINKNLLMDEWKFKATCKDVFDINYNEHFYSTLKRGEPCSISDIPDTIINTACEHIDYQKWLELIPSNKLVVLQNNNFYNCEGHNYCVGSIDEFVKKCNLQEVYYSGSLDLPKYSRYMLIGRK